MDRLVFTEQVRAIYATGLIALVANLTNSAVLVAALWSKVAHLRLLGWFAAMGVVVLPRIALWFRQRRLDGARRDPRRWASVWIVGTALTGAVWGSAGVVLFPAHSVAGQDLVLFVIGGMVAGASASMSSLLVAFVAFAVPAVAAPVAYLLLERGATHWPMAVLLVFFGVGMTAVARQGGQALTEAVRLRFRNSLLIEQLTSAQAQLTQLNRELEERVSQRTGDLQRALAERDLFVSVVSHELRAPLTALKLNQELLVRVIAAPDLDMTRMTRLVPALGRQHGRIQRLVDDLLDLGRLSAERMQYCKEPADLESIVEDTLEGMAPELANADAAVSVEIVPGLRGEWDRRRIQQILTNLISNALKYGKEPFTLTARRGARGAEIVVRDRGEGIPGEHLRRIFEAFHRIEGTSSAQGLGLGLYIAERIVRAHGGTIRAESAPGEGTAFIVELPLMEEGR